MKKLLCCTSFCLSVLFVLGNSTFAQEWKTYQAKKYNLRFDVPVKWKVTLGKKSDLHYLKAESPDTSMHLVADVYVDTMTPTKELLEQTAAKLDMSVDGVVEHKDVNGLDAWLAKATGVIDNQKVGMIMMAAAYDEFSYVAYVFVELSKFEKNSEVMSKILNSFEPIDK
jgi:hypothetical protein